MSKHTPAPWTIEEYGDDDTPTLVIHRGETENRICFMATPGSQGDPAMITANAHLIASAPDLLTALIQIASFDDEGANKRLAITGSYGSFDEPGSVQIARAAIAKVTGDTISHPSTDRET
jgi:hypothetical protein